jgi:hypothetical protein
MGLILGQFFSWRISPSFATKALQVLQASQGFNGTNSFPEFFLFTVPGKMAYFPVDKIFD